MSKGDKVSIELGGGPPWGFRLGGGADFGCPLEIAKVCSNINLLIFLIFSFERAFEMTIILQLCFDQWL